MGPIKLNVSSSFFTAILADFIFGFYLLNYILNAQRFLYLTLAVIMKKTNAISIFLFLFVLNIYSQSNNLELKIEIKKHHNYTLRIIENNDNHSIIVEKPNENFPALDKEKKQRILKNLESDNDSIKEVTLKHLDKLKGIKTDTVNIKNEILINEFEKFIGGWDTIKKNLNEERIVLDGKRVKITLIERNTNKREIKLYSPSIFNPRIASFVNSFIKYYSENSTKSILE